MLRSRAAFPAATCWQVWTRSLPYRPRNVAYHLKTHRGGWKLRRAFYSRLILLRTETALGRLTFTVAADLGFAPFPESAGSGRLSQRKVVIGFLLWREARISSCSDAVDIGSPARKREEG